MKNYLNTAFFHNHFEGLVKRAKRIVDISKFINQFHKSTYFKQATNSWLHTYNRYWVVFGREFFNRVKDYAQAIARYISQIREIKNNILHPLFQRCLKQGIQFKQRWLTHIARRLNHKSVIPAKSMNAHSEKVKS